MNFGQFLLNNLHIVTIGLSPVVVYGVYRLKKIERANNDLTPLIVRLNKKKEAINKQSKSFGKG